MKTLVTSIFLVLQYEFFLQKDLFNTLVSLAFITLLTCVAYLKIWCMYRNIEKTGLAFTYLSL